MVGSGVGLWGLGVVGSGVVGGLGWCGSGVAGVVGSRTRVKVWWESRVVRF